MTIWLLWKDITETGNLRIRFQNSDTQYGSVLIPSAPAPFDVWLLTSFLISDILNETAPAVDLSAISRVVMEVPAPEPAFFGKYVRGDLWEGHKNFGKIIQGKV